MRMVIRSTVTMIAGSLALSGCFGSSSTRIAADGLESLDTTTAAQCDHMDTSHCLLPFPNNHFTRADAASDTGLRIHFEQAAMPETEAVSGTFLGFNVDNNGGGHIDPTEWNRNDGFSPGNMMLAHVPNLDLEQTGAVRLWDIEQARAPDAPIVVINADTGERQLIWTALDARAADPDRQALIIRPAENFTEGERYIVALRNLRNADGELLQAPALFRAYRDKLVFRDEARVFEQRRSEMEDIFQRLADHGIKRSELYLAWDFTVASQRNLTERLLHMRDQALASLGGNAPAFTIDNIEQAPTSGIRYRVDGTYEVPNFMDQPGAPSGARLNYGDTQDPDALPQQLNGNATATAPFRCHIADTTVSAFDDPGATVTPARPAVYGHGLLGSGISEVGAGNVRDMQNEHNFMFCATDWIGMATEDILSVVVPNILVDFSKFPQMADRLQQGILNTVFLAELLAHQDGFASHPAFRQGSDEVVFERTGEVFYDGNSQGGILGGALVAVAPQINRGVLGVPGANYSLLLRRYQAWDDVFGVGVEAAYPDELEQPLGLALIQMLWDRGENNGYLSHFAGNLLPDTPSAEVLMQSAIGDFQVTMWSPEIMARTIGAPVDFGAPDGPHPDDNPYVEIDRITTYPHQGSALSVWDVGAYDSEAGAGNAFPPHENIGPPPEAGEDPHGSVRASVPARQQKAEFLKADGEVIDVCSMAPCMTDDHTGLSRD